MRTNNLKPVAFSLLMLFFSAFNMAKGEKGSSAAQKSSVAEFAGDWSGEEKCQNISAPVARITITAKSDEMVYVSGLYSTVGNVVGTVKGNTITIPRQIIPDPLFVNFRIEGTLTLARNKKTINAIIIVSNNDARDYCSGTYSKQ
ncbi:MAG TPA: hypothetical protein VG603_03270 [Chitinophagales bacterium]|nr:hypothetical protein [Chitinophagales bacterium]